MSQNAYSYNHTIGFKLRDVNDPIIPGLKEN